MRPPKGASNSVDEGEIISYPASAAGTITRVVEAGRGPNVVLFVHGVGARADRWRRNLAVVASAGYRCLAIDLPGHGFAQKGKDFDYGVSGYADFVEAFLKDHQVSTVHLVGTSLGAHVLGALLLRHPAIARSFTLVGATGLIPIGAEARERIAKRIRDRTHDGIRGKLKAVIWDEALVRDSLVDEEWQINNSPGAEEAFGCLAEYFLSRLDQDVIGEQLAEMPSKPPMMLVWGEEDRSVPLTVGRSVEKLLQVPLTTIPRTAHAPYWEAPEAFNKVLIRFLDACSAKNRARA